MGYTPLYVSRALHLPLAHVQKGCQVKNLTHNAPHWYEMHKQILQEKTCGPLNPTPNAPTVGYYSSQYIRISTSLSLHILNSLDFSLSSNFGCLYPMSQDIQTKNVTENSSFELSPPGIVRGEGCCGAGVQKS